MTENSNITTVKKLAKRYARATRIPQAKALDAIALELGHAHWVELKAQEKKGWRPTDDCLAAVERMVEKSNPFANGTHQDLGGSGRLFGDPEGPKCGTIDGVTYTLSIWQDDVHIEGEGWTIRIPEAPNASPIVEIDERFANKCPLNEPDILQKALEIGEAEAKNVQARISSDWPRRSTKPDAKGVVCHPLFGGGDSGRIESDTWFCLHCNSEISGQQIASNLWHCPSCGASPIDIYSDPFWLSDKNEPPTPLPEANENRSGEPTVTVVDKRLKLELREENVTLLIRSALLDDAANAGERIGALLAEISYDEEFGVWVTFETNYWPEEKEPVQARAVAKALGIGFDEEIMLDEPVFAWPGIGEMTNNTLEYTKTMLQAYEQQCPDKGAE